MNYMLETTEMLEQALEEYGDNDEMAVSVLVILNDTTAIRTNPLITKEHINNDLVSTVLEKRIFETPFNERVREIPIEKINSIILVFAGGSFEGFYEPDVSSVWPYKD